MIDHPYPLGTRVVKTESTPDDPHQNGARGTITHPPASLRCCLTTHYLPPMMVSGGNEYAYFVEWDDAPGLQVGILGRRIKPVTESWL